MIFTIYHGYSVVVQDYCFCIVHCIRTQIYTNLLVIYQLNRLFSRYYLALNKKIDIHISIKGNYYNLWYKPYMYIDLIYDLISDLRPYSCTELTIAFHSAICFSSAAITALPLLRCLSTHSGAVPE